MTTPSITIGRELNYSLLVQKNPKRYTDSKPFAALDDIIVEAWDKVDFNLSSPQAGYLYVVNEGPAQTDGLPNFVTHFPTLFTNNGSSHVSANQIITIQLYFDSEIGVEKYWLVWSERNIPELESFKRYINTRERGALRNADEVKSLARYLASNSVPTPEIEKNEVVKQAKFKTRSEVLIGLVKLQHR